MTEKQLNRLCVKWLKILRLQAWDVKVEFVSMEPGIYGGCNMQPNFRAAHIGISNTFQKDARIVEETLVHELLHIMFPHHQQEHSAEHATDRLIGHEFELGIDTISRILVALQNRWV